MTDRRNDLGGSRTVGLVARREIRERLRSRSFWVLTGLLVVAVLAIAVISRLASSSNDTMRVGVVAAASTTASKQVRPSAVALSAALQEVGRQRGLHVVTTPLKDRAAAERGLKTDGVDVAVDPSYGQVVFNGSIQPTHLQVVQAAWGVSALQASLAADGLDAASIERALSPKPLETDVLDDDSVPQVAQLVGIVSAVILFLALQTFGSYVLMGVVEEKSTAVIELLLARAAPERLLAGKVSGIGVCAGVQMLVMVVSGLVALAISGRSIPSELWSTVPMLLVWFLGGYALYSTLFALAGSLVSRQEDAQAASAPILAVLVAAYVTVFTFGFQPHSTASTVLSILPPTAPLLMPMRMAAGAASAPEVAAALVLLGVSVVAAWKVTGRIYGAVVLQRGTRITWRSAIAAGRHRS